MCFLRTRNRNSVQSRPRWRVEALHHRIGIDAYTGFIAGLTHEPLPLTAVRVNPQAMAPKGHPVRGLMAQRFKQQIFKFR